MGQNNDTREDGDKQGQQGGQLDKSNRQQPQVQQEKRPALPEEVIADRDRKPANTNQKG